MQQLNLEQPDFKVHEDASTLVESGADLSRQLLEALKTKENLGKIITEVTAYDIQVNQKLSDLETVKNNQATESLENLGTEILSPSSSRQPIVKQESEAPIIQEQPNAAVYYLNDPLSYEEPASPHLRNTPSLNQSQGKTPAKPSQSNRKSQSA
jgi:hypothetical protein